MNLKLKYLGQSSLVRSGGCRILQMAPNLDRDKVAFDAVLKNPVRFREAISTLHDIVINDLKFTPRDKTAYEQWKTQQLRQERDIRIAARKEKREELARTKSLKPSKQLKTDYQRALKRYWKSRRELNSYLRQNNQQLWRKLMPYDPVITVAEDVLSFECFSADESSYGCLSVDRDCFGQCDAISLGTTNVDYSWALYDNFQNLRTYRETRFNINPEGFEIQTSDVDSYREEKIDIPDGWLNGLMQLQSAMALPMRKVSLSINAVYSLLAFLRRNKSRKSPRAIRFELSDGQSPRLVIEPWDKKIISSGTTYTGHVSEPIRIWGRRRLLTLARVLPLVEELDVYLLGTGLPSFWVAKMGDMRLTLGLSGWTTNDWTKGSAVQMLLPQHDTNDAIVAKTAEKLKEIRASKIQDLSRDIKSGLSDTAAALNQLALRGQAIYDLYSGVFRWRQILPVALSDKEVSGSHPEQLEAKRLLLQNKIQINSTDKGPRGGWILTAKVDNQECEALIDADGLVRRGKCRCSWHYRFGIRNGPCRHIQAVRNKIFVEGSSDSSMQSDWYEKLLERSGQI